MKSSGFDRENAVIHFNGKPYVVQDDMADRIRRQYGQDSFEAEVAAFLEAWCDSAETVSVRTSGSTGKPKSLSVRKDGMVRSARLTLSFLGILPGQSTLLCLPMDYIAGKMMAVRALVGGLRLQTVRPCGHPLQALSAAPDFLALTPMQAHNSIQVSREGGLLRQVKNLILGGGGVSENLQAHLSCFPNAVWSTYGMTETLSHIALRRLNGPNASPWYTAMEGVSLSQADNGCLRIGAPHLFKGSWQTHDVVRFNEKGQFQIMGRLDNILNTGGIKVQTEAIEAGLVALDCPFQITAVPDEKYGEAIVLLLEAGTGLAEAVIRETMTCLPRHWRPKYLGYTPKLPYTPTGKPDRSAARRLASSCVKQGHAVPLFEEAAELRKINPEVD